MCTHIVMSPSGEYFPVILSSYETGYYFLGICGKTCALQNPILVNRVQRLLELDLDLTTILPTSSNVKSE